LEPPPGGAGHRRAISIPADAFYLAAYLPLIAAIILTAQHGRHGPAMSPTPGS
jgi:hypothetical protein